MATPNPLSVRCPRCHVPEGRRCNVGLYVYRPALRSHNERARAAREAAASTTTEES